MRGICGICVIGIALTLVPLGCGGEERAEGPDGASVSWPPRSGRHDAAAASIPPDAKARITMYVEETGDRILGSDGRFWPVEGSSAEGTCTTRAGEIEKTAKASRVGFVYADASKAKKVGYAVVLTEGEMIVPIELFAKPPKDRYVENSYACEDFGDRHLLIRLDPARGHGLHVIKTGGGWWVTAGFAGTRAEVEGVVLKRRLDGWYEGDRLAEMRDLASRVEVIEARKKAPTAGPAAADPARRASRPGGVPGENSEPNAAEAPGNLAAAGSDGKPEKTSAAIELRRNRAREILAKVKAGSVNREEINDLWDTLAGSGLEGDVIKAFAAHAKAHPNDTEGHYGLGVALMSKLLGGTLSQMEVGALSVRADKAFSKALAIDDRHFEARCRKAISYTFWPDIAGKRSEAIKHFEILVQRHGSDASNPMMKDVYFALGNEYRKAGNMEKAREAYRQGLGVFPDAKQILTALEAIDQ